MNNNNNINKEEGKNVIEKNELLIQLSWRMSFMKKDLFYMKHEIDNDIPDQYKYRLKSLKGNIEKLKEDLEKLENL